jgi:hypothetical protein
MPELLEAKEKLMTRTTLFDNGDFSLHARLTTVISPEEGHALTISSQRQESCNPHEEHVKFFTCLDREGLAKPGDLI